MNDSDFSRVRQLFAQARDLTPPERERLLERECHGNPKLHAEVKSLLEFHDADQSPVDALMTPPRTSEEGRAAPSPLPETLGPFQILGVVGQGGMGTVYRARQENPKRDVALKVVRPGLATTRLLQRLEYEAQVLARLQHPGIAQIFEAGTLERGGETQPYFAMELVQGAPLDEYSREHGLSIDQRLRLLVRICDAVQHAHQKGVIHRDLKPGNILVTREGTRSGDWGSEDDQTPIGQPKILDFGIARVTDTEQSLTRQTAVGQVLGTLPYMSPEQVSGDSRDLDSRADVYSLGVLLYELLSGRLPHSLEGASLPEATRIVCQEEPPRLGTLDRAWKGDLESIASKALRKDREQRYSSAHELAADLLRHLQDEPILARPPSATDQIRKFARRNKALVGVVLIATLSLVAALGFALQNLTVARTERDAATLAKNDAERAAERAEAVRRFFLKVLVSASPEQQGPKVTVVEALQQAQSLVEESFSGQPELRADVHSEMSVTFHQLGDFAEAEHHARQALEIRRQHLGPEHPQTLVTQNDLASVLLAWSNVSRPGAQEEAEALLDSALRICRAEPEKNHRLTIDLLANRVALAHSHGQGELAEQLTREALALSVKFLGPDSPTSLDQEQNLAILESARNPTEEAARRLERVLEKRQRIQGPRHPDTFTTQRDLATALKNLRQLQESEHHFRALLPVQAEVMGADHPEVIMARNQFAHCLRLQDRTEEAADEFAHALDLAQSRLGDQDYLTMQLMDSLATTLEVLGEQEEAEELHLQGFESFRDHYGIGNAYTQAKGYKAVLALLHNRKYDFALELVDELLSHSPFDRRAILQAAKAQCLVGLEHPEADAALAICYDAFRGNSHVPAFATALRFLIDALDEAGRDGDAEDFHQLLAGT